MSPIEELIMYCMIGAVIGIVIPVIGIFMDE